MSNSDIPGLKLPETIKTDEIKSPRKSRIKFKIRNPLLRSQPVKNSLSGPSVLQTRSDKPTTNKEDNKKVNKKVNKNINKEVNKEVNKVSNRSLGSPNGILDK